MTSDHGHSKGAVAPFVVPELSIIIPVHNQWRLTSNCISSILAFPPAVLFEIIVVNDGSSDDTVEQVQALAASDGRIRLVTNDPPHRFARACNCGACASKGDLLLIMNNDIEACGSGWFEPLRDVLESRPEVGIVAPRLLFPNGTVQHCGKVWQLDQSGLPRSEHYLYEQPSDSDEARQSGSFLTVTGACMLLRREQFMRIGPFDEQYENGWEDDDLCLAFRSQGLLSWVCAESTLIHHQGGTLKAEALVLERYLKVLKDKGITLAADDPLIRGLQQRTKAKAEQFEQAYRSNRDLFVAKWGDTVSRLLKPPPQQRDAVTIIIITYNSAATITACLESLVRTVAASDRVVVIDNSSRDATCRIVGQYRQKLPLELIQNKDNRGFSRATNQGIRRSMTPLVVLLNPDTVVTVGWLERLAVRFDDPQVAGVGPVSNFAAGRQSVACHWSGVLPNGVSPEQAAEQLCLLNRGKTEETKLLIGFCLMMRRSVIEQLGGLDERLFLGNDDLELSWRLRLHHYHLLIAADTFVWHEGQHSFRSDPETVTGRLLQESSDALYLILSAYYGAGRVPDPMELWGIDWFTPAQASFDSTTRFEQVLHLPERAWAIPESDKALPLVSIVILTFNQWHCTEECLLSISRHTPEPYELIIVDNGSADGTPEQLTALAAEDKRYRLILNSDNRGYAAGCNQGMLHACGRYIVLLNNDVVVTPEWLSGLLECHASHALAGIVGPLTNNASGIQVVPEPDYAACGGLDLFASRFRVQHRFRRVNSRRVVGFCMLFSRSLIDEIGLLDEQFGTGNYEDDDFCIRAAVAGYQNLVAADVYIHHYGSMSFKGNRVDYRLALVRNAALFQEKWSRPVCDPVQGQRIEICRVLEKIERLLLDEQLSEADSVLQAAFREHPDDQRLQKLAKRIDRASSQENGTLQRIAYLQVSGDTAYAQALLLNSFMLEPWLPHLQQAVLRLAMDSNDDLAQLADDAFRLYPESRGLARLRVELAALKQRPEALPWAEAFLAGFGLDDRVFQAAGELRKQQGFHQAAAAPGQSVALCMIVKNEEHCLARCLASCKPLVHELVVVDTGSTDRTCMIAELFGAKVYHLPWQDDFSAARNFATVQATADWILIMDADEALSARDYQLFKDLLQQASPQQAFSMTTRNYTHNSGFEGFTPCCGEYPESEKGAGWTASTKVRLFPNHCGVQFSGVIHEMVEDSLTQLGIRVKPHPVPVHHYGALLKSESREKQLQYLALGLQKCAVQPDDPKALYELAVQAAELEQFDVAGELWRQLLEARPDFARGWFNLGYALLRQGKLQESVQASEKAITLEPGLTDAVVNRAIAISCLVSGKRALEQVLQALEQVPDHPVLLGLAALGLYRSGEPDKGRVLIQRLCRGGHDLQPLFSGIVQLMDQQAATTDREAILQAAADASVPSAVSPSVAAASTSSCS